MNTQNPGFMRVLANMKGFIIIYLLFLIAGLRIFYIFDVENRANNFNNREQNFLAIQQQYIGYELQAVVNDIGVMIGHQNSIEPHHDDNDFKEEFDKELTLLCTNRRNYKSAKIIDRSGKALVAVNCQAGNPEVMTDQSIGDYDEAEFARQIGQLNAKAVFLSDITDGGGNDPYIRIAAALEYENNIPEKFIILNYLVQDLTSSRNDGLMMFNVTAQGGTLLLTNNSQLINPFVNGQHETARPFAEFIDIEDQDWIKSREKFTETDQYYINRIFISPQQKLSEMLLRRTEQLFSSVSAKESLNWSLISLVDKDTLAFGFKKYLFKCLLFVPFISLIILPIGFAFRRNRLQQKIYQWRLDQQRTFLITMMDSMHNAVIATDSNGLIQTINPSATRILGYTTSDLLNKDAAPILPTGQTGKAESTESWLKTHSKNSDKKIEYDCVRPDGSWVPIELAISRSVDPENPFYLLVIRDMTYRREVEKEMKNLHQKYIHREKLAEVGLLVGGILHEVSNPLAAINGLLSNLVYTDSEKENPSLDKETLNLFNIVFEHVERVRGLSYEVSSFLRPTSNEMALTDLNSVIHTTTSLIRFDHRWRDVNLDLKLDRNLPPIRAISDQLVQVVMNLLVNAADACTQLEDSKPEIELGTLYKNHMAQVYIQDNGIGMDNETIRKIFQPFFTTKGDSGGTGLGLPLCEGIINDHGGHLEVESNSGTGTRITCYLPVNND